jgi:ribosomal protein S12 methylthiotransferase
MTPFALFAVRSCGLPPKKSLPLAQGPRVGLVSLGCPKNLVDSEVMLGKIARGATVVSALEDADVVVVNTCAFVEAAKQESIDTILEMTELKRQGKLQGVIVTGCLAQRYPQELKKELVGVDAIVGVTAEDEVAGLVAKVDTRLKKLPMAGGGAARAKAAAPKVVVRDPSRPFGAEVGRLRLTPRHYAYLRVAEGCDHACTFCAIPSFRGRFRSKPGDAILEEARELAADGARELCLIAEDTNQWGQDMGGGASLAALLEQLAEIEPVRWLRILYAYPAYFPDALVRKMAEISKVAKYVDIPLQHIADPVLRRMRRPPKRQTVELLERLRAGIPGLALRTTFICGFPGETERDHEELLRFVEETKFDRLGAFAYSEEDGTPAGGFEDQVPVEVREARRDAVMAAQQKVAFAKAREKVGRRFPVIVDEVEGPGRALARSEWDAPEIDGVVKVWAKGRAFAAGEMLEVEVVKADGYDLEARPVGRAEA